MHESVFATDFWQPPSLKSFERLFRLISVSLR